VRDTEDVESYRTKRRGGEVRRNSGRTHNRQRTDGPVPPLFCIWLDASHPRHSHKDRPLIRHVAIPSKTKGRQTGQSQSVVSSIAPQSVSHFRTIILGQMSQNFEFSEFSNSTENSHDWNKNIKQHQTEVYSSHDISSRPSLSFISHKISQRISTTQWYGRGIASDP
jgi:hypothetical protein